MKQVLFKISKVMEKGFSEVQTNIKKIENRHQETSKKLQEIKDQHQETSKTLQELKDQHQEVKITIKEMSEKILKAFFIALNKKKPIKSDSKKEKISKLLKDVA